MEGIKHSRQFAETESLMDNYFVCHIVPVMKQTQVYLNEKQGEEMKEYSTSLVPGENRLVRRDAA